MEISKSFTFIFAVLVVMLACSFNSDKAGRETIIGQWRNKTVKIIVNSFNNTDSVFTVEADEQNWEARLKSRPIRTYFKEDGTYLSEYRNLKDSIFYTPSGVWKWKGDSPRMTQLKPHQAILNFKLDIHDTIASFHGLIDFDGDGKRDDEYFGTQKRFK